MASRVKKPADISQEDWESVDVPEATDAEFATARPFKEVFPAQYKVWKKMGRPPVETPKIHIGFRLAADVVMSSVLADELTRGSTIALALSKSILDQSFELTAEEVFGLGSQAQAICYTTSEHRQAVDAFLKKE